jgi:hypothetical protein
MIPVAPESGAGSRYLLAPPFFLYRRLKMKILTARKTEFKGQVYKSKSEAIFANMLFSAGYDTFDYEPEWTQLDCGYIADFEVCFISETPFGLLEFQIVIEYKPAEPTETYIGELLKRFIKIRDTNPYISTGTLFMLVTGSAFDSRPCKIYTMSDNGAFLVEGAEIWAKKLKWRLQNAKEYRFDLASAS